MKWLKFPWDRIEPGQAVFIPCLDTEKVRELGLRAAIPYRINLRVTSGIRGDLYGVLFKRLS